MVNHIVPGANIQKRFEPRGGSIFASSATICVAGKFGCGKISRLEWEVSQVSEFVDDIQTPFYIISVVAKLWPFSLVSVSREKGGCTDGAR